MDDYLAPKRIFIESLEGLYILLTNMTKVFDHKGNVDGACTGHNTRLEYA